MASNYIYGTAQVENYPTTTLVYVKKAWSDAWMWIPWLACDSATDATNGIPQATFTWRYGYIQYAVVGPVMDYYPFLGGADGWPNIGGWYIKCESYSGLDAGITFVGVVDDETIAPWGTNMLDAPSGIQQFSASGLQVLLDRIIIRGGWGLCVGGANNIGYVDMPLTHNKSETPPPPVMTDQGPLPIGNAGTHNNYTVKFFKNYTDGTGGETAVWTNEDILRYILYFWVNNNPELVNTHPTFAYSGDWGYSTDAVNTFCFEGQSVWSAIQQLAPKQRGVSTRIQTNGEGSIYINAFSVIEGQNLDNLVLDINDPNIEATLNFKRHQQYNFIEVRGGAVYVCCTFKVHELGDTSYDTAYAPMVPVWTSSQETAYKNAVGDGDNVKLDTPRGAEKFKNVYQRFKVPDNWDWTVDSINVNPAPLLDGTLDFANNNNQYAGSHRFERFIPFYADSTDGSHKELRKPFVVVKLDAVDEQSSDTYCLIDKLTTAGKKPAALDLDEYSFGVLVEPTPINHVAALDEFDPESVDTDTEPQYRYYDYLVTAMFKTSSRLRVRIPVDYASVSEEVPSVKLIEDPEAEAYIVPQGTVYDIDPTDATQLLTTTEATLWRCDTQRLVDRARWAALWYGQQRAEVTIKVRGVVYWGYPGQVISGITDASGYSKIGTVVVSRTYDLSGKVPYTIIKTAFEDMQ